jgi:CO/xanthine dehydrogenase FAD-binding subunit
MATLAQESLTFETQVSLQVVYEAPESPALLRRTLTGAVTWQQRNETTVERALRSPSVAPQWVAALLAWGASVTGLDGPEELLADFLHRSAGQRGRAAAVHLPLNIPGRTWGEAHVARTPADVPIVAAIAVVDWRGDVVHQAHLALTGVWRVPVRLAESVDALIGGPMGDEQIAQVALAVQNEATPPDDFFGSADYRRAMAGVLTRRALEQCRGQEVGNG